jgi:AcrR family transcriptional regulator
VTPATAVRKSADERREAILEVALTEFARAGFHGTSTEAVAAAAGISQPYLFRLFGTKKGLFVACMRRCFRETLETFQRAAEGLRGPEALEAAGEAYMALLSDRSRLKLQLHAYAAAADDAEVRNVVRQGFGDIFVWAERVSGQPPEAVSRFFAGGMLLNVVASMELLDSDEPWAARLLEGCRKAGG